MKISYNNIQYDKNSNNLKYKGNLKSGYVTSHVFPV